MKDKKVTNSELLRLATYHGTPRPGDARHVTPTNVSRLQKISDMHPSAPMTALAKAKSRLKIRSGTMVPYEIDGSILVFRASGTTTLGQREPVFDAVRADGRVPNGALLLLDVREVDVGMSKRIVTERLRVLWISSDQNQAQRAH
jgi:hypothetical protein